MLSQNLALPLLVTTLPDAFQARLSALFGNLVLKQQPSGRRLLEPLDCHVRVTITDTDTQLKYRLSQGKLLFDNSGATPDIHISGKLKSFLLLASGKEDADTLFFSRHLTMQGNTEDGLLIKNVIDAIDFAPVDHFKEQIRTKIRTMVCGARED